ncbi:MAG: chloride channel protein [Acidimicrobiia bacterium]|jgi:CIC family chloride channel protein
MTRSIRDLRLGRTPRLMILSALVGTGAGLGAVILIEAIRWVTSGSAWLIERLSLGEWGVILVIPLAIWISWRLTVRFAPEVAGHGVPQIIAAIAVRGGRIRERVMVLKTAATALTIGTGGSAGREGSIAQIGSSIGSALGRLARFGENDVIALVAAGAGAGISATFNAPIAGMFFAMEVILREISVRHLHTIVIASVSGAVVAHTVIGDDLTFEVPSYSLDDPRHLFLYGLLGLVAVAFAWLFLVALDWFEVEPRRLPAWARPLLFGLAMAALGLVWHDVLGTGQDFVNSVLSDESGLAWWSLATLAVVKAIATSLTLGGRGSGGIFMPSLFIGATTGSAFAQLAEPLWKFSAINPGAFGLVGMAATFSAVARAPLTSILIVFEITGDYGLVLPLMVATMISTILASRVRPESAYTSPLARMGIHPTQGSVTDLLDTVLVGDIAGAPPVTVAPDASLGEVQGVLQRHRLLSVPVVSEGSLVGVITETDVVRSGGPSDQVKASDAMTPNPVTVNPLNPVSEALERMAALGVRTLPIVAGDDPGRLIGIFTRDDVVTAYHRALGARSQAESAPERLTARTRPSAGFFDLDIPPGSVADGRPVSEVPWPEACILVSIHRGSSLLIPRGDTPLRGGDSITVYGSRDARDRLFERLVRTAEAASEEVPGDE